MKKLLTMNIKDCMSTYEISIKKGNPAFAIDPFYSKASFIPHCLSLFATIPLLRNDQGLISMVDTMDAIPEAHETTEGVFSKQLVSYLVVLTAKTPRSTIMNGSAVSKPLYGGFTPLFMYAHKLYNNIEYTEWDKDDAAISYALGKTLDAMLTFAKANTKPIFDDVAQLRTECMTYKTGKKAGQHENILSYKMSGLHIDDIKYPADILRMQLQTWIANVELRDTNSMILDIWDWANVPVALDIEQPVVEDSMATPWV